MQEQGRQSEKEPSDYLDTVSPHKPVRWFFKIVFWIMQALNGGKKKAESDRKDV